jgi:mannose-6-phosphate isomerase
MATSNEPLYPLILNPVYKPRVWGGRALERLAKQLPGDEQTLIGESWELVDFANPDERSTIANGPQAGMTLQDAIDHFGERLLGRLPLDADGRFPLLLKYLDAQQALSVQVHPGPDTIDMFPGAVVKHEAWYIVDAEPDAVIYKGLQPGTTAEQLRQALDSGEPAQITALLRALPARRGDCHYLPAGTCHALGAGVLVAEVQTPSDTTFRLYDWGRSGRELHIEQALQCMTMGPTDVADIERRTHIAGIFTTISRLIMCPYFRIERIRMGEGYEQEIPYDQPTAWMVMEGRGTITATGIDAVEFERGQTLLMPAAMIDPRVQLSEDTAWLEITFPQTMNQELV